MPHFQQTNRRRSSSLCYRHPSVKSTTGFCASCLRERLAIIESHSSSPPAAVKTPDLRRIRSYSVRNASVSVSEQPRRRSCDARSSASSLHDLFADDDEEHLDTSIRIRNRKPLFPDLKEEEEDIEVSDEDEIGEHKTMKEFIDLDWRNQIKKNHGKDLKQIASVFSTKLKRFSLKDGKSNSIFAGNGVGRHSCDTDPRLLLLEDGGFEKPRSSWDGCLIEKTYTKLTPLSAVTEDAKSNVEDNNAKEEKSPGGTVQTKNYYSDSRRRKSFDRNRGLLEIDELKAISNSKVSPESLGLFHGAKLLVTEKELRDSNWYSIRNQKPESIGLASNGNICKQDKKPRKKWPKGWNIWGLIQRKTETKNEIKIEQSLKLEGNAIEGSLAESLLKLRRVSKGETNGEKLLKSYSISARKSCDGGVFSSSSSSSIVGGRSSCDGLFHGSSDGVKVGRSSCDGLGNDRERLEDGSFRFYVTPVRSHRSSKSGISRLMN